jgi:ubiquinone/menaquinone biosynthesis C-methylase UbiE
MTNMLRFILDELLPPIIRDNKFIMKPLFWIWYKGKNVDKLMEFKSQIHKMSHEEFAEYYRIYDSLPERETDLTESSIKWIMNEVKDHKDASLIDIGCGNGYLLKRFEKEGFSNLTGIDIHPPEKDGNIHYVSGNVEELPFEDNSFDIVTCNHMIEHVLRPEKTISEIKRIAKKKVIITLPKQRYYRYTFELHINFYPQESYALRLVDHPDAQCEEIGGDWSIKIDL